MGSSSSFDPQILYAGFTGSSYQNLNFTNLNRPELIKNIIHFKFPDQKFFESDSDILRI